MVITERKGINLCSQAEKLRKSCDLRGAINTATCGYTIISIIYLWISCHRYRHSQIMLRHRPLENYFTTCKFIYAKSIRN
jgi:hypothetical protein